MSTLLFEPIKTHSTMVNEVNVAFSGGKDSIVTLDLCKKYFDNVKPFFMQIVPGLEFQETTLRKYEKYYDVEILRVPHPELSAFMRYGTFREYDLSVPEIEMRDVYSYVRSQTGIPWIAAGERINDSLVRRAMIKHSGTVDFKRFRMYPLAYWDKYQVVAYIKNKKLMLPRESMELGFSFSSLSGKELATIKQVFPEDYKRILEFFPLADVSVYRYEKYGETYRQKFK